MDGVHDMGGMHGFGPVVIEPEEPVFHADWQRRVLGIVYQIVGFGWSNIDAFRHGIERMDPVAYLSAGYYGRWLASLERLLVERGLLATGDVDARIAGRPVSPAAAAAPHPVAGGFTRELERAARFRPGDAVRARI